MAVPERVKGTEIVCEEALSRASARDTVVFPSLTIAVGVENCTAGSGSSSRIVIVWSVVAPRSAPTGVSRVTSTVSVGSSIASSKIVTVTVPVRLRAAITAVAPPMV